MDFENNNNEWNNAIDENWWDDLIEINPAEELNEEETLIKDTLLFWKEYANLQMISRWCRKSKT